MDQTGPRFYDACLIITWQEARVAEAKPSPYSYHNDFGYDVSPRENGVKMTQSSWLVIQATPGEILVSFPRSSSKGSSILSFKEGFCEVTRGGGLCSLIPGPHFPSLRGKVRDQPTHSTLTLFLVVHWPPLVLSFSAGWSWKGLCRPSPFLIMEKMGWGSFLSLTSKHHSQSHSDSHTSHSKRLCTYWHPLKRSFV